MADETRLKTRELRTESTARKEVKPVSATDKAARPMSLAQTSDDIVCPSPSKNLSPEFVETLRAAIFDNAFEFIGLLQPDGTLLDANQSGLEFVRTTLAEVKGRPFWETPWWSRDAESRARLQAGIAAAARGEFVRFEAKHHGAHGAEIIVDFSLKPIVDAQGSVVMLVPEGRNIAARKQSEAALQQAHDELERKVQERTAALTQAKEALQSEIAARKEVQSALQANEARFAGIINSAMDAIISVDSQQHIVLFNHAAEQMFGYTAAEMMGQSLERLLPTSARAKHTEHMQRFGETKTTTRTMGALGAISGVRKDGEEFPIEASISQVEANGQKLYTVILRDITRRKEAEERLREQAALLNHAHEAIVVIDIPGNILFWNSGAERLYGWAAEEVIGRIVVSEIFRLNQEQREAARRILMEKGEWTGEFHHHTKDGREITVESHLTLVRDAAGEPKSILIINNDITEQKQLEAQFLRAQRLESIGTLASGIAHDLNNVLSPLLMAVQLLQTRLRDESSQQLLGILQQNVQRGSEMIKQVLAFARGTSGERLALQPRHLIKEVIAILKETFPKDILIKYSLPGDLASVSGDPTQLHQVLMNLCVNARDAMAEGGGTLTITVENKIVDAQMAGMLPNAQAGHYLIITIADTGTGIAPDVLEKIFDPFFTTKEIGRGTGLGLSTVHSIIQSHGGFVNVYSEVGRGTRFYLYMPALATTPPQPLTTSPAELPVGHGEWVLVVDDEKAIQEITQTTLESFGYHVLTAADGIDAVAKYAKHQDKVHLVLTDMMMPYLDGPATIRALRNINPALAVIASSGLSESEKAHEAEALGVQAFLTKPYSAADLLQTLAAVINRNTHNFTATWHE